MYRPEFGGTGLAPEHGDAAGATLLALICRSV